MPQNLEGAERIIDEELYVFREPEGKQPLPLGSVPDFENDHEADAWHRERLAYRDVRLASGDYMDRGAAILAVVNRAADAFLVTMIGNGEERSTVFAPIRYDDRVFGQRVAQIVIESHLPSLSD